MPENNETLTILKSMSRFEKIIGSSLLSTIIGAVVWVTIINKTVGENTQDINSIKTDIRSIRDTLPNLNIGQAIMTERDRQTQSDIKEIKEHLNKQDERQIRMYDMINDIYKRK